MEKDFDINMYDFFVIGHISLDENIDLQKTEKSVGGAILYSSSVYSSLGFKVAVLTKLSPKDKQNISQLNVPEEDIYFIPSKKTTSIRNVYFDESREKRVSTALSAADPFLITDIPRDISARVIHFASLIYGEYQADLIKLLSPKAKMRLMFRDSYAIQERTERCFIKLGREKKPTYPILII